MECRWQVEKDPYCQKVLAKHWPDVGQWDDVCTFPPDPAEDWSVDVICGGFPCQDISYAGKGAGLAGERSGLFYEAIRIIREVGPRVVVLENVAALLTRGLDVVLGTLGSLGYDCEWHCIPAAAVGASHVRDRVFVVAHNDGNRLEANTNHPILRSQTADAWDAGHAFAGHRQAILSQMSDRTAMLPGPLRLGNISRVPGVVDRLRGLGNAVVPQVAEWIGRRIVESFPE